MARQYKFEVGQTYEGVYTITDRAETFVIINETQYYPVRISRPVNGDEIEVVDFIGGGVLSSRNITRMLMNPATGSVDCEAYWRSEYESLMAEGESGVAAWGGTAFEDAGLIEVRKDENGDWVEVKA